MALSLQWGVIFATGTSVCTVVFAALISRILSAETKPMTLEEGSVLHSIHEGSTSGKSSDVVTIDSTVELDRRGPYIDIYTDIYTESSDVVELDEGDYIESLSDDVFGNVLNSVVVDENIRLRLELEARLSVEQSEYHERLTIISLQHSCFSQIASSFVYVKESRFDVISHNHVLEKFDLFAQQYVIEAVRELQCSVDKVHEELAHSQIIEKKLQQTSVQVRECRPLIWNSRIPYTKIDSMCSRIPCSISLLSGDEQLMLRDMVERSETRQLMWLEVLEAAYQLGRCSITINEEKDFFHIERSNFVMQRIIINFANEKSNDSASTDVVVCGINRAPEDNYSITDESHYKLVECPDTMIEMNFRDQQRQKQLQGDLSLVCDEAKNQELKAVLDKIDQEANKLVCIQEKLTKTLDTLIVFRDANDTDQSLASQLTPLPKSNRPTINKFSIFDIHGPHLPFGWEMKSVDYSHPIGRAVIQQLHYTDEGHSDDPKIEKEHIQHPEILVVVEDIFYKDTKIKTSEDFCSHCIESFSLSSKNEVNLLQSSPMNRLKPTGMDWFCQFTVTLPRNSYSRASPCSAMEGEKVMLKLTGVFSLINSIGYAVLLHSLDEGEGCETEQSFMQFAMSLEILPHLNRRKRGPDSSYVQYLLQHHSTNMTVNIPVRWWPLKPSNDIPFSFEINNFDKKEVATIFLNDTDSRVKMRSENELDAVVVGKILRSATIRKTPVTHQRVYYGEILSFPLRSDIFYPYAIEEHCFGQFELTLKLSDIYSDERDNILVNLAVVSSLKDPLFVKLKYGLELTDEVGESYSYISASDECISKLLLLTKKTTNRWFLQDWTVPKASFVNVTLYANELAKHAELLSLNTRSSCWKFEDYSV